MSDTFSLKSQPKLLFEYHFLFEWFHSVPILLEYVFTSLMLPFAQVPVSQIQFKMSGRV